MVDELGRTGALPWPTSQPVVDRQWTTAEVSDLVGTVWRIARDAGIAERTAAGAAELDAWWNPVGRRTYAEQVAARVAEFEECAAAGYRRMGYQAGYEYRGGPVDFETGLPARSVCAWARRYARAPTATVTPIWRAA